jgi:hypothetical protein
LLNFKDEPEEVLDRFCSTYLNREPGEKLRDLSLEMLLRSSLVVKVRKILQIRSKYLQVVWRCLMKNSASHYGAWTRKGPKRSRILLVSLLVTAGVIAASFQTFAQNVPDNPFDAPQTSGP